MPYPPTVPPNTRTNSTPSADNHPLDHNMISAAFTEIINHIAMLEATVNPVGIVQMWGGDAAPANWMLCQGQVLDRATYPTLFALIGTRFNTGGETATQFRLPAFQGRSPMGFYPGGGWAATNGMQLGYWDAFLPYHTHPGVDHLHGIGFNTSAQGNNHDHFANWGRIPHESLNPVDNVNVFDFRIGDGFTKRMEFFDTNGANPIGQNNQGHLHAAIGSTQAADRSLTTGPAGADGALRNLGPSVVLNFIIRVQ